MTDKVTLTLAHPLTADQAGKVLAEQVRDYGPGEKIRLRADYALSVINAGYAAGVDPNVPAQVRKALGGDPAGEAVPTTPPVEGSGADGGAEARKTTKK